MTFSNFFSDYLGNIEWLDALIGAVVLLALAWAWYGPLFGKKIGTAGKSDPVMIAKGFVKFFLYGLGIGLIYPSIHVVFQNAATFETLFVTSLVVSFFMSGLPLISSWVWDDGGKLDRWIIDYGFWFVGSFAYAYVVLDLLV